MSQLTDDTPRAALRVFMSQDDVHYAGGLVAGARILGLFGDAATALLLERDGVEGLLASYSDVQFLRPVFAGDTVDVEAALVAVGNSSRRLRFRASVNGAPVCTAEGVAIARPLRPPRLAASNDDGASAQAAVRA
jgi:acyl-CoA hydrolase